MIKFNQSIFTSNIKNEEKSKSSVSSNDYCKQANNNCSNTNGSTSNNYFKSYSSNNLNASPGSSNSTTTKRLRQFDSVLSKKVISLNDLKSLAWKGIPFGIFLLTLENKNLRSDVWKFLLGYFPLNIEVRDSTIKRKRQEYIDTCLIYESILDNPSKLMNESELKIFKQISVDVPRTMPEYRLFGTETIRKMMLRLLYVWSMRHPASGYVQGFNDLCTPFFVVFISQYLPDLELEGILELSENSLSELGQNALMEIETDTYWCFAKMMDRIQANYTHNQPGLTKMVQKMEQIIQQVDEDLYNHLLKFDITFMQFCFRWMNCYLMREFTLIHIIRLWDTYFSEEDAFNNFHLYVCAGLLLNFSEEIKKMGEFQETMMFLQNMPMSQWTLDEVEVLLAKAFQISAIYGKIFKGK